MGEKRTVSGYNIILDSYCSYCPDFEAEIEKVGLSKLAEPQRSLNNIRCKNRFKCARIADRMERKIEKIYQASKCWE